MSGAIVYVGGAFSRVGDSKISNVAALDAQTAAPLGGWAPAARVAKAGTVTALAITGHRLLVGDQLGVEALDSRTGRELVRALPRFREANWGIGGVLVSAIAVAPSTIYVGGQFSHVGTKQRTAVVALNSRKLRVTSWYPGFARVKSGPVADCPLACPQVFAIALNAQRVYLAGAFTRTKLTRPEISVAAFDSATASPVGWSVPTAQIGEAQAIAFSRGAVAYGPGSCKGDEWSCTYPGHPGG